MCIPRPYEVVDEIIGEALRHPRSALINIGARPRDLTLRPEVWRHLRPLR
jgi:hypothetical protein